MPNAFNQTITGYKGAFQQPGRWGRNESGNYQTLYYEGSKQEVYNLAANVAQTIGLAYEVLESFGKFRLEIYFPWTVNGIDPRTDYTEKWELFAQHVEKDLLTARAHTAAVANLTVSQVQTIRFWVQNPPDPKTGPFPVPSDFQKGTPPESINSALNAFAVYNLMAQGVTSFPIDAPTLRRTITTSNQYATAYALDKVGVIMSTNYIRNVYDVPYNLLFNLPNDTWTDPNPNSPTLVYGWYKKYPVIQMVALLKWSIVQEWEYGLWSTLLYGNPLTFNGS